MLGRGQYRVVSGYDQPNEQHTNILQYMDVLGLPVEELAYFWDSMPSDHFGTNFRQLSEPDCVVGFGLPNILYERLTSFQFHSLILKFLLFVF